MPVAPLASNSIPQLVIPPLAVAEHPDTITDPAELHAWLADLPLADAEHLAEHLHRQLKHLIRDPQATPHYRTLLHA